MVRQDNSLPLISIITPSYNSAEYIEETILSVIQQEYPFYEHIIVDGGSTDGTLEILHRYSGRVRWISEHDSGQAEALNKGIALAKGTVLGWLNADDTYNKDALWHVSQAFAGDDGLGLIYSDYDVLDENSKITEHVTTGEFSLAQEILGNLIPCVTAFFRRNVLTVVGPLRSDLHYVLDIDLWLRIALRFPVQRVSATFGNFRICRGTKTYNFPERFWIELISVYEGFFASRELQSDLQTLRCLALAHAFWQAGLAFYSKGDGDNGRVFCNKAILDYGILDSWEGLARDTLLHSVFHSPSADPETYLDAIGDDLNHVWCSRKFAHRVLGEGYGVLSIHSRISGDLETARRLARKCLVNDVRWITNFGFLSTILETILGPRIAWTLRRYVSR